MPARRMRTLDTLELVGGTLSANFVNTVNARPQPEHDYLSDYADLLAWGVRAGSLTGKQGEALGRAARQHPQQAEVVLEGARDLRETLHRVLAALAAKMAPPPNDLQALQAVQAEALAHAALTWQEDHYEPRWLSEDDPRTPLWPVAYAAGALLFSSDLRRLKACPNCGWLFLDDSKNGRRRWCSMDVCGVSDKMRRYHGRRTQAEGDGAAGNG